MMQTERLSAALVVLLAFGCGDKKDDKPTPAESSQPKAAHDAAVTKDVASKETKDLDAAAKGVLATWLDAQNRSDFLDGYEALYAPSFRGVRKSGEKRVELGREEWFKDRARMFTKKMNASADEPKLSRSGVDHDRVRSDVAIGDLC